MRPVAPFTDFFMRIWDIDDSNAIPSDLVREQDFILRVRRLQRLGTPHLVVNLVLNAIEPLAKSRRALEVAQDALKEFARVSNGVYADMSNGDVFIVWEGNANASVLTGKLAEAIMPGQQHAEDHGKFLLIYRMPMDYTRLRERTNHYVEVVRAASIGTEGPPSEALRSEAARGPLTAWSVDQIGKLLNDIDLRRYGRTQPIYRSLSANQWQIVAQEYYVSFEDLRRERFPKLEIVTPEHMFLALCELLDQRLLTALDQNRQSVAGRPTHLNLSINSVLGAAFTQFARNIPREQRKLICCEIHRGDLLQDFTRTLDALSALHAEGFLTALDSITPDMANYINLAAFDVDYIKINVSRDRAAQLIDPAIRKGLAALPPARLIFFRCDNDKALMVGRELGVTLFQGWLIDDDAQGKRG
jgi:EAL domain-containing protein (putative c-di-GMP-specific phosphodiesterase class I)